MLADQPYWLVTMQHGEATRRLDTVTYTNQVIFTHWGPEQRPLYRTGGELVGQSLYVIIFI